MAKMIGLSGGGVLEAKLKEYADRLGRKSTLNVGFLEGATAADGTPIAYIAAINEFGAMGAGKNHNVTIPPRPAFRNMIAAKNSEWGPVLGNLLKQEQYDAPRALDTLGTGIAGQLQQSIRDFSDPPNAPSTIAAKGFDKPLIDTGDMVRAVDHEVET
jgi:hypothetical protein